jgi:hypothetical protein
MNDQHFFDLAMKVIARQANDAERADLDALLAREPELRAEFTRLEADARVAKEALPLVNAMRETKGELPVYARGRLRTMVRQTLGRPESVAEEPNRSPAWGWRWVFGGLATATAVLLLVGFLEGRRHVTTQSGHANVASHTSVAVTSDSGEATLPPTATSNAPVILLAMLDTAGGTRGADMNELATLQEAWKESPVQHFSSASELEAWEKNWINCDGLTAAKIIYDPAAGEVRVSGRSRGKFFQRTFLLEKDLATTLQQVGVFIREQTKR